MKNHEIPSHIWSQRNKIIEYVEKYMSNSNNIHYNYKNDMSFGATCIRSVCEDILKHVEKYQQPIEK